MENHCFKVHEDNKTFDDAKATCVIEGGRMAVLDDLDTFLALNDYIRANHAEMVGYLLGLTDRVVEGEWRWEDGNLFGDVPEFNRNQPNDNDRRYNGLGANCGYASVVWHNLHKAVDKLYDDNCEHPATFVCERVTV
ncbi:perlucin-like protein [Pecten maximus]|uniref:perlucin-like protein n=1 Tax=Pecten maximus TaxID=6579 RepID=UPI001457F00C|nr:perlucin-like protein [Pecten maximus]